MKANNIVKFLDNCFKGLGRQIDKHKPEVLAGTGICLFVTSAVHAVAVTPKAMSDIEDKKVELNKAELTKVETVKAAGLNYVMPAIEAGLGTACVVMSVRTSTKRYTALYGAYGLLQESYDIYKEKVIETIGENKNKKVEDAVGEEMVKRNYNPDADYGSSISANGTQLTFFMDSVTGRFFYYDKTRMYQIASRITGNLHSSPFGELTYMETMERYLGDVMQGDPGVGAILSIYQQDLPQAYDNEGFQFIFNRYYPCKDGRVAVIVDYNLGNANTKYSPLGPWKISSNANIED